MSQATGNADRWQLLPRLSDDEYQALKRDVAAQGVLVPVVIDADSGEVIEGHHRVQAWTELRAEGVKVPDYPKQLQRFDSDDDRVAFVLAANLFRRHLSRPQRAEVVASLRHEGWSVRRIAEALGVGRSTVGDDIEGVRNRTPGGREPAVITGRDDKTYPARRPRPVIFVQSNRDARRAADALRSLDAGASGLIGLSRAEEQARIANLARARAVAADGPAQQSGEAWELRIGDFREVLADLVDGSIDAIVTDPPYDNAGVPIFEPFGAFAARALKPGRLAVVYAGHLQLDREMELLERGGLTYTWHGANVLKGRHTRVRVRMVFGQHRSVLLYSAGPYRPRKWLNDIVVAEGRGGPEERPLHPWQQALEPVRHWVRQASEPGELIVDPFIGSGTTAVAAVMEGRRFIGCDIDPGCVETTRHRLVKLANDRAKTGGELVPPQKVRKSAAPVSLEG